MMLEGNAENYWVLELQATPVLDDLWDLMVLKEAEQELPLLMFGHLDPLHLLPKIIKFI